LSNITFCWNDETTHDPEYYFVIAKAWDGDKDDIDTKALEEDIVFTVGDEKWMLGYDAIEVEPGDKLYITESEIEGLPTTCTSESDLDSPIMIPGGREEFAAMTESDLSGTGTEENPYVRLQLLIPLT
jgi:hypothetical protein